MKKGAISIDGTGIVSVSDYTLKIGKIDVVGEIARQLGIKKDSMGSKEFSGHLSLVIESTEVPTTIENTITDDETPEENNECIPKEPG